MYSLLIAVRNEDGTVKVRNTVEDRVAWRAAQKADKMARCLRRKGYRTLVLNERSLTLTERNGRIVTTAQNGRGTFVLS